MRLGLIFVLAIVACAQVKEDPPRKIEAWETAGGARLRPIFVTVGGVRQFVAFEDRKRGERCQVVKFSDDERICWPRSVVLGAASDAGCTQLNAALDERCDGTSALMQLGGEYFTTKPIERGYRVTDAGCGPITLEAGSRYVVPADPVSRADFVKFTVGELDVGDRLELVMYYGEDGSRFVAGLKDSKFDDYCTFGTAADGSSRCLPIEGLEAWDETCSHRVSVWGPGRAPNAISIKSKTCEGTRVYATSDLGEITVAQRDSSGTCKRGARHRALKLEGEIPPSELAADPSVRVGDTRIKQWVATIGTARVPGTIVDDELGAECLFKLDGGAYRCLPESRLALSGFSDATCSAGLACLRKDCQGIPRYTVERASRCAYAVRSLGAVRPAAPVFVTLDGQCSPTGGVTCDEHRDLGPLVPREKLATGNVVVE